MNFQKQPLCNRVVYICASLLQLAVQSPDFSQAEAKMSPVRSWPNSQNDDKKWHFFTHGHFEWKKRFICSANTKVSFFDQCIKKQSITLQNFHIQTCFSQFLWFFSLKWWFKGQMMSKIHLSLPNAYKLMCFDRNINGNRDVKFLECD